MLTLQNSFIEEFNKRLLCCLHSYSVKYTYVNKNGCEFVIYQNHAIYKPWENLVTQWLYRRNVFYIIRRWNLIRERVAEILQHKYGIFKHRGLSVCSNISCGEQIIWNSEYKDYVQYSTVGLTAATHHFYFILLCYKAQNQ